MKIKTYNVLETVFESDGNFPSIFKITSFDNKMEALEYFKVNATELIKDENDHYDNDVLNEIMKAESYEDEYVHNIIQLVESE